MNGFVAVLVQNMGVYGCKLVIHQLKFNISSLSRFMKPGSGMVDGFVLQHHHLYQTSPHFGGNTTSFVDVLAQNTCVCVCGCRPVLYYSTVNFGLLGRFKKTQMRIMDNIPVQPRSFLQSQSSFWRKMY